MFDVSPQVFGLYFVVLVLLLSVLPIGAMSVNRIGPNEVGLVVKRWGREKRSEGPLALRGDAGYQADLLMPGVAFRLWPVNRVEKHPWVQIPTGEIGLVIAQVGGPLPTGWKSGIYRREFRQFTANWAEGSSQAHTLDKQLKPIVAKSKEGFVFNIDLQVQIHVADRLAPKVISMVGTMQNLVNEVLQAVVGNYFRDTLQGMAAAGAFSAGVMGFLRAFQRPHDAPPNR